MQGTLDPPTRATFEQHLDVCSDCSQTVAELARLFGSASRGASLAATGYTTAQSARAFDDTHYVGGAPDHESAESGSGVTVGRYVLGRRLGAGGMGVVFEAHDPELHRRVAIKLLHPGSADDAETTRTRLLREARAMARLAHPNVVAVHDVGRAGEQVFVAMELVEGTTLTRWIAAQSRTQPKLLETFVQAGRGLEAAHAVGLVHRDFKPDNVLIGADGRARVTDFGLARPTLTWRDTEPAPQPPPGVDPLRVSMAVTTAHGAIVGTPAYMSPEQWRGEATDARTDQFSFCIALYEALFSVRPFRGRTWVDLCHAVLHTPMHPPPRSAPSWLRAALVRGLTLDPNARFASMAELLTALSRDRGRALRVGAIAGAMGLGAAATVGVLNWVADETTAEDSTEADAELTPDSDDGAPTEPQEAEAPDATTATPPDLGATEPTSAIADAAELCVQRAASADGAWTAERRSKLIERMHTMNRGTAIVSQTMPILDAWVDSYATEAAKPCSPDASLSHEASRTRCLSQRRASLDAWAARAVAHPAFRLQSSIAGASYQLPSLRRCADDEWLAEAVDPAPPEVAPKAHLLRSDLAANAADTAFTLYGAATGEAERIATEADALAYPPVQAEAQLAVGLIAAIRHDDDAAVTWLEQAAVTAELAKHTAVQVDAAVALIVEQGAHQLKPASAKRWLRIAQSVGDRTEDAELGAKTTLARGRLEHAVWELVAAKTTLTNAVEQYRHALGEQHPGNAAAHLALAQVLLDLDDAEQATKHAEAACKLLKKRLGPNDLQLGRAQVTLARAHLVAGKLDAAADAIKIGVEIPFPSLSIRHDFDRGDALLVQGDTEAARGDTGAALETYKKAKIYHYVGPLKAQPLLRRGALLVRDKKTAEGLAQLQSALDELLTHYDASDPRLIAALRVQGNAQRDAGQFKAGRKTLQRALDIADSTLGFGPYKSGVLIDLARLERLAGQPRRALELFDDAHVAWVGAYSMDHPAVVDTLLARADLAFELGDKDYAGRLYRSTLRRFIEIYGEDSPEAERARRRKTDE